MVVGDGTQRGALQALIANHRSQVTHLPYCADAVRLAKLYRAADLFVHPGIQETFGLVALEAQACGTPVIGISGSYMDRIIHNDLTLWARQNTATALAVAIVEASANRAHHDSVALHNRIAERYSWSGVFRQQFELYREVIAHYRRP